MQCVGERRTPIERDVSVVFNLIEVHTPKCAHNRRAARVLLFDHLVDEQRQKTDEKMGSESSYCGLDTPVLREA